ALVLLLAEAESDDELQRRRSTRVDHLRADAVLVGPNDQEPAGHANGGGADLVSIGGHDRERLGVEQPAARIEARRVDVISTAVGHERDQELAPVPGDGRLTAGSEDLDD